QAMPSRVKSARTMRACRWTRSSVTSRMRFSAAPLTTAQITAATLGINQGAGLVSGTVSDNTSVMLLAKYAIGPVKLYGGYEHMQFANPNNPLTIGSFITGGYSLGARKHTNFT